MAALSTNEKQLLEKLFQMSGGYVLNFSDREMREFFRDDLEVNIDDSKYHYGSGSKANRMRGFWQEANDALVGLAVKKLIEYIENQILLGNLKQDNFPVVLIRRGKEIANRLHSGQPQPQEITENEFINREFKNVSVDKLQLDGVISEVLRQRIDEIRKCLTAQASLATIFLCGSTLEGILLGVAAKKAQDFNQAQSSPKYENGKVKKFHDWKLSNFIDVAHELGLLGIDVKKFSHALRDFRNYIHPYQQLSERFNPDQHTAKMCWQVLQAVISQLSK